MKFKQRLAAGLAAVLALSFSACSTEGGPSNTKSTPKVLNQIGWGGTTWQQNFNLFSPTGVSVTPGTAYLYEPLVRVDRSSAGKILPYLATEWSFNEKGTELTFKLRNDVKWSDGTPFTSADVKFTWELVLSGKTPAVYPFKSVATPDDHTVVVTYAEQNFQDLVGFAIRRIVPKHIWEKQNVREWTNPEPVGTGPVTLQQFSPQQIVFKVRDDWWGGKSKGVEQVQIHAVTGDSQRNQVLTGQVDFGTFGWQNAKEEFVAKDPKNNYYGFYPVGTSDGIIFNTQVAPYNDPHVRRALRAAIDLKKAAEVVAVGYSVPTYAGLDATVYSSMLAENQEQVQNVDYAKKQLAEGGWTVQDGKLVKDGKSYSLRYDVYQPYSEWVQTGTLLSDMWRQNLGLEVAVNQMADAPFTEASTTGSFGMASGSPVGGSTPYDVFNTLSNQNYKPIGEQNLVNQGRWRNDKYDKLVQELASIAPGTNDARAKEIVIELQQIITDEAPFIATATAGWKAVINGRNWKGFPVPGKDSYAPNATLPGDAPMTIMNLEPNN